MPYQVEPVSPSDAAGLATAMMSAFYTDEHWRLLWGSMPLTDIISDCTERLPWNLITSTSTKRHLKTVDVSTGDIVGYSRYILPAKNIELWLDAQTAKPSEEEKSAFEKKFKNVTVDGRMRGLDYRHLKEFGPELEQVEDKIMSMGGPYVCKFC